MEKEAQKEISGLMDAHTHLIDYKPVSLLDEVISAAVNKKEGSAEKQKQKENDTFESIQMVVENSTSWKTFNRCLNIHWRYWGKYNCVESQAPKLENAEFETETIPSLRGSLEIIPGVGYHPYYLADLKEGWLEE